jgi:alpha-tubulin suppressor-like RCC1 family protein
MSSTRNFALFSGNIEFLTTGKAKTAKSEVAPNVLPAPHLIQLPADENENIEHVFTGSAASHCFIVTQESGSVYAFGRNDRGQLGLGDLGTRGIDLMEKIDCFGDSSEYGRVTHIACGKQHTLFLTESGDVYAAGDNTYGQIGNRAESEKAVKVPTKCALPENAEAVAVDAGIDFSLVLDSNGVVYSFGIGEHGKLGNGTDGSYNASASSVKMKFEGFPTPTAIKFPSSAKIAKICAGNHHCIAVDVKGTVFVWGDGTHGRLGLGLKTADVLSPVKVEHSYWTRSPSAAKFLTAGATSSILVAENGVSWIWGKVRTAQEDSRNTPQVLQDLQGWNVNCISAGPVSVGVGADESCILWGNASGELGFGAHKKSSSQPAKNDYLEGYRTVSISLGLQHTLFLAQIPESELDKFDYVPGCSSGSIIYHEDSADTSSSSSGKRKGSTSSSSSSKSKKTKQ